jgi:putative nucleotide binding protein
MEEYIYILDVIPYSPKYKGQAYGIGIGEKFFALLEVTFKKNAKLPNVGEKTYVGKEINKRAVVDKIKRRLSYNELTTTAKENLESVIKNIVKEQEKRFVSFINNAGPLTIRVHQLEQLPGVGKKTLEQILKEREISPFKDFEDIKKRVNTWQDVIGSIAYRIIEELEGKHRHNFFVKPV